jgi:hypothetical protein
LAVKEGLSDSETRQAVAHVSSGRAVSQAVAAVLKERREGGGKPKSPGGGPVAHKVTCPGCGKPVLIEHTGDASHRVLKG